MAVKKTPKTDPMALIPVQRLKLLLLALLWRRSCFCAAPAYQENFARRLRVLPDAISR